MSFLKKQNFCLYAFEFRERKSRNYEYEQWEYEYRISSNKRRALNKRHSIISAASLGIHIEISVFL